MRRLGFLFCIVIVSPAFANNAFIPNHYRNRRSMDSLAALGWSERREVGMTVQHMDQESRGQSNVDSEHWLASPYSFYRLNENWNTEAQIFSMRSDASVKGSSATGEGETQMFQLGAGYEMQNLPMALGVSVAKVKMESRDSNRNTSTEIRSQDFAVGLGYRLLNDFYLGAGMKHGKNKVFSEKGSDRSVYGGLGMVLGEGKVPSATAEFVAEFRDDGSEEEQEYLLRGLWNMDAFQFYGELMTNAEDDRDKSNGDSSSDSRETKAGFDYQWGNFYLGPEWSHRKNEDVDGDWSTKQVSWSLQAGYRTDIMEVSLTGGRQKDETFYASSQPQTGHDTHFSVTGSYHF